MILYYMYCCGILVKEYVWKHIAEPSKMEKWCRTTSDDSKGYMNVLNITKIGYCRWFHFFCRLNSSQYILKMIVYTCFFFINWRHKMN